MRYRRREVIKRGLASTLVDESAFGQASSPSPEQSSDEEMLGQEGASSPPPASSENGEVVLGHIGEGGGRVTNNDVFLPVGLGDLAWGQWPSQAFNAALKGRRLVKGRTYCRALSDEFERGGVNRASKIPPREASSWRPSGGGEQSDGISAHLQRPAHHSR
ncbi:hypothetical protein FOZ60_016307 [Perkinsus olseni]|uniref:Uncharacterized protein n=1 Tax=Perkinsus olseni TaxID=32597 RepID=A0A7J6P4Q2_PEROL|nr:hypothetical protein FOZ60_016307 [Perkinsus olseni]